MHINTKSFRPPILSLNVYMDHNTNSDLRVCQTPTYLYHQLQEGSFSNSHIDSLSLNILADLVLHSTHLT